MRQHERAIPRTGDPSGVGRHRLCHGVGPVAHRSGAIEDPFSSAGARHRDQSRVADSTERYAVLNVPYTVNCSILLTELPLLDRPHAARDAGFAAVEFWWPFEPPTPTDAEVTAFIQRHPGCRRAADRPELRRRRHARRRPRDSVQSRYDAGFRDNVDIAAGIAETLGTRAFNALYGNRVQESSPEAQDYVGPRTSPTPRRRRTASARRCSSSP